MKKPTLAALGLAVLISAGAVLVTLLPNNPVPPQSSQHTTRAQIASGTAETTLKPGRFISYEQEKLQDMAYRRNVLFFHASWCPECHAYEQAITAGEIPTGTQILKVDYDSSAELKKRYGVTLQSTFIAVDRHDNVIKKWVGYGKEKSVAAIVGALYEN